MLGITSQIETHTDSRHTATMDPRSIGDTNGGLCCYGKVNKRSLFSQAAEDDGVGDFIVVIDCQQTPHLFVFPGS